MTQTVSAKEIQAAGGLEKWLVREATHPSPSPGLSKAKNASIVSAKPYVEPKVHGGSGPASVAKGRLPSDLLLGYDADRMNKLEARYSGHLELERRAGRIVFWRFESLKFRLADRTWYTPDFYVMRADGGIEIHEAKGFWEDDSRLCRIADGE